MDHRTAAARPGARAVDADVCARCGAIWLDGHELAEVSPELGGLPQRLDEIRAMGAPGKGIPRCPRCGNEPLEIALLDVAIDVCPDCAGVWLDGGEYEALARAADEDDGLAPRDPGAPVHGAAVRAAKTGEVDCVVCAAHLKLEEAYCSDRGMVCRSCFHGVEQERLRRDAASDHGDASEEFREGAGFAADTWKATKAVGFGVLMFGALLAVGSSRCHACGRRCCHSC
jgi:Zn-finger nucleic acid-binding protein